MSANMIINKEIIIYPVITAENGIYQENIIYIDMTKFYHFYVVFELNLHYFIMYLPHASTSWYYKTLSKLI